MDKPKVSYNKAQYDYSKYYSQDTLESIKRDWFNYINSKYTVGYSEENTCTIDNKETGYYRNFNIVPQFANIWGRKVEDIHKCRITIIEDNIIIKDKCQDKNYDNNSTDYFGWISFTDEDDKKHRINLIQSNIKLFSMQFSSGGDYEVEMERGKIVRIKVDILD